MSDTIEEAEFSEDVFESMLNGSFNPEEEEDEDVVEAEEEDAEDADDLDADEDEEHQEDTDLEDDDEEDDTDYSGDGEDDEEEIDEDDDLGEDALVGDNDSDDEDSDSTDEVEEDDESEGTDDVDTGEESEDNTDTDDTNDGEGQETDAVDYKAFYDAVVNTEFAVNGRKAKGFSDPKKIIQSMQMAGGFSEKMAGFKQYKPFMGPLKDRGILEDPAKFDLAMNILDGDKEAIKQHLSTLEIDPMDLDMEAIQYTGTKVTASQEAIVVDEALERARVSGVEDKFRNVIGKQWDDASFNEFVSNPKVRNDLLEHIETGAYDTVQNQIAEMRRLDFDGTFSELSSIQQYRAAAAELSNTAAVAPAATPVAKETPVKAPASASVKEEKAKIAKARKEAAYKKQVKAKNAKTAEERRKATSISKRKAASKPKPKFDPMKVEGDDLDALMDSLISGGR